VIISEKLQPTAGIAEGRVIAIFRRVLFIKKRSFLNFAKLCLEQNQPIVEVH
jgi:hypothetical protein